MGAGSLKARRRQFDLFDDEMFGSSGYPDRGATSYIDD
jgi:hypothetical protein